MEHKKCKGRPKMKENEKTHRRVISILPLTEKQADLIAIYLERDHGVKLDPRGICSQVIRLAISEMLTRLQIGNQDSGNVFE